MTPVRAAIAAGVLAVAAAAPALAADPIALDRGAAYELVRSGPPPRLAARIYVTRAAGAPEGPIAVTLRSIADGKRTDPGLTGLFEVTPATLTGPRAAFDVTSAAGRTIKAGTYEATITFAIGATEQHTAVQLIVPPATLSLPATLQLERVVGLAGGQTDATGAKLHVLETSGKSDVELTFDTTEPLADAGGEYGATVSLPTTVVAPGAHAAIAPTIDGNLPIGVVKGKLAVRSNQLAAPLALAVQVRTRLTRTALVLLIVAGLGVGFALRVALKRRIEVKEARQRAFTAYDRLIDRSIDPVYKDEMAAVRAALAAAILASEASKDTLGAAITAADAGRQQADSRLNTRRELAIKDRAALAGAVARGWTLPATVDAVVKAAAAAVDAADRHLRAGDIKAAQDTLTAAIDTLGRTAPGAVATWATGARAWLDQLRHVETVIEKDRLGRFADALKPAKDALDGLALLPGADLAATTSALSAAHQVTTTARAVAGYAGDAVQSTFAAMEAALAGRTLHDARRWLKAGELTADLVARVRQSAPDAAAAAGATLDAQAQALRAAWREALLVQADGVSDAKKAEKIEKVKGQFGDRSFAAAATGIADLLPERPDAGDDAAAQGMSVPDGAAVPPAAATVPGPAAPAPPPPGGPLAAAESLDALRARTVPELLNEQALQWVVSMLALTFIGYVLLAETFVGTWQNLLTAFMWGFTTDIGVDAIVAAGKKTAS